MKLTPQEEALYQYHLNNLQGTGKVLQPNGSVSTILQTVVEKNGKYYNVPTVVNGKVLTPDEVEDYVQETGGFDKWPSYSSQEEADSRYMEMHKYMDQDVRAFLKGQRR